MAAGAVAVAGELGVVTCAGASVDSGVGDGVASRDVSANGARHPIKTAIPSRTPSRMALLARPSNGLPLRPRLQALALDDDERHVVELRGLSRMIANAIGNVPDDLRGGATGGRARRNL